MNRHCHFFEIPTEKIVQHFFVKDEPVPVPSWWERFRVFIKRWLTQVKQVMR